MLRMAIPFNAGHGFRVSPLPSGGIRVDVPMRRNNRNHIRGIHACCLATAAELCSGLALMEHVDPAQFRIIMRAITMEYHLQAKGAARAEYAPALADLERSLLGPLQVGEAVLFTTEVQLRDKQGHVLATGRITWQVKAWDKVRTKV